MIGKPFAVEEMPVVDTLDALDSYTLVVNDPPWSSVRDRIKPPTRVVDAWDMELSALEALHDPSDATTTVVGLGGGTALDTAKYLAWRGAKRLIQIPTITSVDAGFTDAIGIRDAGRVRYIGTIEPELVVLDIPLIRSAPKRLNRAGIGDILSCHTGLHDWYAASSIGLGAPWRDDLAELGRTLLLELNDAADDIHDVTADAVRFIASAYRRVGAACAEAGHSRFEEGSEHFWAYCYEHATGAHQVHGELITLGVAAMSHLQGNEADSIVRLVRRCGTRAHPNALGITRDEFVTALIDLHRYARTEELDISFADLTEITAARAADAWDFVHALPGGTE